MTTDNNQTVSEARPIWAFRPTPASEKIIQQTIARAHKSKRSVRGLKTRLINEAIAGYMKRSRKTN